MVINLRPSAAHIWVNCAANPRMSAAVKTVEHSSDAAREGTCAAWVGESVLRGEYATCAEMEGKTHENGWVVTDDMVYFVQDYVNAIRSREGTISAELTVRLNEFIAGTFDASTVSWDETTLHVDDLKYGYKIVEVWENEQTIIYAYAEYIRLNNPRITHVVLGIYQPRAWHVDGIHRTWRMTVQELYEHASRIAAAGEKCQEPDAPATPGSHCEYCKARGECAALAQSLYKAYDIIESRQQGSLTADELAHEMNFLDKMDDLLKARKTAIHAEADHRIGAGEYVPGWGFKDRFGHRQFSVDMTTVHLLTGIEPKKTIDITPAEIEKAGADKKTLKLITRTPKIGRKLDRITDRDFGRMFRDR